MRYILTESEPVFDAADFVRAGRDLFVTRSTQVIAGRHHTGMLRALEKWGFEPIPCDLLHHAPFGGSFHCATLDVRRRGSFQSYID